LGLISWLSQKLNGGMVNVSGSGWCSDETLAELYTEACYRDLALWTGIDLIAKSISKCEFKTFIKGKEDKNNPEWYRWNIEPNKNQNSSAFLRKLVATLFFTDECLVVESGGQLLVADSFQRTPYALYDDVFEGVTVGNLQFQRKFYGNEVLYWNLKSLGDERSIQSVVRCVAESYAKLLAYGMKSYQTSRGNKALFKYEAIPPHVAKEDANKWLQGQIEKYGKFLSADGGVATVGKGLSLDAFDRKSTYSNETTRDIRAMIDDISDFTAKAFGIPPALLRGDVQGISDALDQFLTFCIDPLADMLREEIVRKTIGQAGIAKGYDLIIDTSAVKHIDVLSAANNIDKLIGSGVFCVNEILKLLGSPIIDEAWAWRHFVTRNYMTFEEAMKPAEGGD